MKCYQKLVWWYWTISRQKRGELDTKIKMVKYSARQTNIIFDAKIQIVFCESELWTIIGFLYRGRGRWKGKSSKIRSREEPPLMRTDVRVIFDKKNNLEKKCLDFEDMIRTPRVKQWREEIRKF